MSPTPLISRRTFAAGAAAIGIGGCTAAPAEAAYTTPWLSLGPRVRDRVGSGINPYPTPGPKRAAEMGFGLVRINVMWDWIELERGRFWWDTPDALYADAHAQGLRQLLIVNPVNTRYNTDNVLGVARDEIEAMQRFYVMFARRYRHYKPIWEIFNEPNFPLFWKPKPDADAYTRLARLAIDSVRESDPHGPIVIGALSGVGAAARTYLERCLDLGLGEHADAVSMHPYTDGPPEDAIADYAALRALLQRYPGRRGPLAIIQSEWGIPAHVTPAAIYESRIPRIMLTDLYAGLAGSFYYKLIDEKPDYVDEYERNYGILTHDGREKSGASIVRTLLAEIGDATQITPIDVGDRDAFVMQFATPQGDKIVGWRREGAGKARVNGMTIGLSTKPQLYR